MMAEERAERLYRDSGWFSVSIVPDDWTRLVARAIRDAENEALERAADQLDWHAGAFAEKEPTRGKIIGACASLVRSLKTEAKP